MSAPEDTGIAISGGGIAGLAAALLLAQRGFKVSLFERNATLSPDGAGIQLSPNAFKVLAGLGLGSQLRAAAGLPLSINIGSGISGKMLTRFALGPAIEQRHGAPYAVLHRADLASLLLNTCLGHESIDVVFGHEIIGASHSDTGVTVDVRSRDGGTRIAAQGLVGADGVWSKLRTLIPRAGPPVFTGRMAWRAVFDMEAVPEFFDRENTGLWLGPKAHVVHYPLRGGAQMNVVAITPAPAGTPFSAAFSAPLPELLSDPVARSQARFTPDDTSQRLGTLTRWIAPLRELTALPGDWGAWPLFAMPDMTRCAVGNVCLIGDAAHAMEPFAAQGGSCAIEDAAVLADACARSRSDLSTAFASYENQRLARVRRVVALAAANRRIYHLGFPAAVARDLAMRLAPQEALQRRMDWLYGWQPPSFHENTTEG